MNDILVEDNGPDKGDGESNDAIVWESDLDYGQSEQLHDECHEGDLHLGEKLPLQMSTSKDDISPRYHLTCIALLPEQVFDKML